MGRFRGLGRIAGVLAAFLFMGGPATAGSDSELEIGITPYYSTRLLFEQYEPLRHYLEKALSRKTFLATATDFRAFAQRTRQREFRFIFTVPHFGRLAQTDDGYRPLLQMKAPLRGTFLVPKGSPVTSLGSLQGRSVASPDPLAIITMMGADALAQAGLISGKDVHLVAKPTHNAAVLSALNGETDAALVWLKTIASMEPEIAERVRVIGDTIEIPIFILFLAAPDVPEAEAQAVAKAVLDFADTEEGRIFQRRTAYGGIAPVGAADLALLDRYLPVVRRALKE